jgi:hypothetical protein
LALACFSLLYLFIFIFPLSLIEPPFYNQISLILAIQEKLNSPAGKPTTIHLAPSPEEPGRDDIPREIHPFFHVEEQADPILAGADPAGRPTTNSSGPAGPIINNAGEISEAFSAIGALARPAG